MNLTPPEGYEPLSDDMRATLDRWIDRLAETVLSKWTGEDKVNLHAASEGYRNEALYWRARALAAERCVESADRALAAIDDGNARGLAIMI